ncbi:MAG: hypothetical protein IPH50_10680 [Rhodanobacteraceae bacterium]|nr:hypothetical protein [Rhodanobacteraceae bacterium]
MSETSAVTPMTVADYAFAVESLSSGRFTGLLTVDNRKLFASLYGAPFAAIARLAPEVLEKSSASLLIADTTGLLAAESGRWLSLYARARNSSGKLTCTICVPVRPRSMRRPPKPLLFQPAQQVLVKHWSKHLSDLDTPPDILILYVPDRFDKIEAMAEDLCKTSKGRKVLLACHSRAEVLLVQALLHVWGCQLVDTVSYDLDSGESRPFAPGAWWVSVVPPKDFGSNRPSEEVQAPLRLAFQCFWDFIQQSDGQEAVNQVATVFSTRTTRHIGGESINAVRLSLNESIDLASGRYFSIREVAGEESIVWSDRQLSSDDLVRAPKENTEVLPDEDRLNIMLWLGAALNEAVQRDEEAAVGDLSTIVSETAASQEAALPGEAETLAHSEAVETPLAAFGRQVAPVPSTSAALPRRSRLSRSAGTVNVLALAALLEARARLGPGLRHRNIPAVGWLRSKGFIISDASMNAHVELSGGEVSIETDGADIWSMRFDDRRTMDQGAIWRIEATLIRLPRPAISLRLVQVRSSEDAPPPPDSGAYRRWSPPSPGEVRLEDAGVALSNAAVHLSGDKQFRWLAQLLLNTNRTQPVIVICGEVDDSANRLAKRLTGVAHVVCIDHGISAHLVRVFGRDRSVFGHAVRFYRPGFKAEADPDQHPLWTLKGAQLAKWLANDIFEEACAISLEADDLEDRAPSFQAVRSHLAELRLASSEQRISRLARSS